MSRIKEISRKIKNKEISALEITEEYLKNLKKTSVKLGTYISLTE